MDIQTLENRVNALLEAVEGSNRKSYEFQEYADALKAKFEELTNATAQIPDMPEATQQSLASKFETIRQRVDINASYAGTDESIFKDFLSSAQEFVLDIWSKITGAFGGITGDSDDATPGQSQQPSSPGPEAPAMQMMAPPPTPPMAGGRDRIGPGGSNFSRANIIPSDTQQYLKTFDPQQKALDREMKERGYQKVGPGGLRRERDGSIRRKSQYGGAIGSLSNFLGDVGNTLTKNRKTKP